MKVQKYILKNVEQFPNDILQKAMKACSVSRTTVQRHMNHLVKDGKIIKTGTTRNISYALTNSQYQNFHFRIDACFDEFSIFHKYASPFMKYLNKNAQDIFDYIFTEMVNNSKDHSRGIKVDIEFRLDSDYLCCSIKDDGLGVFQTLGAVLNSKDTRDIMFELSKGKLTSDPSNHTGEGIFFSSRATDIFAINANKFTFIRDNIENDWSFYENETISKGTCIEFKLNRNTNKVLTDIFIRYQDDELAFVKTDIIIDMSKQCGERLISRSQAQRVVRHLEKFSHITLDFKHVRLIGQGFVDQVFRVYQNQHPQLTIEYINANKDVEYMIKRGLATARKLNQEP